MIEPISHAREWLARMARALPKAGEAGDVALRLDDLAGLVASKVPSSLLNQDSLEFCLRRIRFLPSYAELWGRLQAYQREVKSRGSMLALPAPVGHEALFAQIDTAPLSTADRIAARIWLKRAVETDGSPEELTRRLGVVRRYNPATYQWLCAHNEGAAAIARRQGWADADGPHELVDPTRLIDLSKGLGKAMRPTQDTPRQTPIATDAFIAAFEQRHGRKPGALTPEQLALARQQAGIKITLPAPRDPDPDDPGASPFGWDGA